MEKIHLLGETRRQRLMLKAIDISLAREEEVDLEKIADIGEQKSKIAKEILAEFNLDKGN